MALPKLKFPRRVANPIETATNPVSEFMAHEASKAKKATLDQFAGVNEDFFSQLLGITNEKSSEKPTARSGEMRPGESISLNKTRQSAFAEASADKPERRPDLLPGIDYRSEIVHSSERLSRREATEMDRKIQDIMNELKRLVDSSSTLRMEFAEVSVQQAPAKAGKYYVHFFEWLLIEIRKIRSKVEDSGAWLSVMKSKKAGQKYGAMAKKHGTSFTLSNERTAATQTG